jgi:hypothetical protein
VPGGIAVVCLERLPTTGADDDDVELLIGIDAEWVLVDARACPSSTDEIVATIALACIRNGRRQDRTCAVVRTRSLVGSVLTFGSVEDACQMKLFLDAGYGAGWRSRPQAM